MLSFPSDILDDLEDLGSSVNHSMASILTPTDIQPETVTSPDSYTHHQMAPQAKNQNRPDSGGRGRSSSSSEGLNSVQVIGGDSLPKRLERRDQYRLTPSLNTGLTPIETIKTSPTVFKPRPSSGVLDNTLHYDFLCESSSEEGEGQARPKGGKQRTLRKTKSRGKGKGRRHLTPVKGLEDFAFDNKGYSSDSEQEGGGGSRYQGGDHKQCWS